MTKKQTIHGFHAIEATLHNSPQNISKILLSTTREDQRAGPIIKLAQSHHVLIERLPRKKLDEICKHKDHQGIVAFCHAAMEFSEQDLDAILAKKNCLILILDGVQDPHNLGACLRSANAFGVDCVIAPKDKAVGITPVVRKVASGAVGITPFIQVTNLARTMRAIQDAGVWIVGASDQELQVISEIDLSGPIAMVMGSEGQGMRKLTAKHCDFLARVPMLGTVGSLNVSVATGVCLYEAIRQRM